MRWHVHRERTEQLPGGKPAMTDTVQRRGRSHGRGIPDCAVWPVNHRRPCVDPGQPQTNIRICGQTRESELGHRRLKASPLPLHDQRIEYLPQNSRRGRDVASPRLTRDIRAHCASERRTTLRRSTLQARFTPRNRAMRCAYCALRCCLLVSGKDHSTVKGKLQGQPLWSPRGWQTRRTKRGDHKGRPYSR
jgi:hypothetical protein